VLGGCCYDERRKEALGIAAHQKGVDPQWCGTARGSSGEDGAAPVTQVAPMSRCGAREPTHTEDSTVR
jgi:hypothetical protein